MLEPLREALLRQYRCRILYHPPHRDPEEYLFDPYTLLFFKDSLYLGGYAHNRKALRLFLVDRFLRVDLTEERFDVPSDFKVEDLTGSAFGLIDDAVMDVRVRFAAPIAHLVRERTWHPTQALTEEPDGSLILAFSAGGEKELLSWLYSYIPHVQVLSPSSLKAIFAQGIATAFARLN